MSPTIRESIKVLLSSFPSHDSADPKSAALGYLLAVEDETPEAVAEAVRRFIRGEVKRDRHTFMPSAAELAIEVRGRAEMIRIKAAQHRKALAAPSVEPHALSPDARAKVGALMADLADKMRRATSTRIAHQEAMTDAMITGTGVIATDGTATRHTQHHELTAGIDEPEAISND